MLSLIHDLDTYFRDMPALVKLVTSLPLAAVGMTVAYQMHIAINYPRRAIYSVRSYRKGDK
jgi:hypothetical protein